jgi:hypothetical protein
VRAPNPPGSLPIRAWITAALVVALPACSLGPERDGASTTVPATRDEEAIREGEQAAGASAAARCAKSIAVLTEREPEHELVRYRENLAEILIFSKIVPVVYLALPEPSSDPAARALRESLVSARRPERKLRELVRQHRQSRPLLRDALLREGYLFEHEPGLARALVSVLRLADLFDEPRIHLHRGGRVVELTRDGEEYRDEQGTRAKVLLNDRVAVDRTDLARPLHLDLDEVREVTGALGVVPLAVGEDRVAARLSFPSGLTATALLASDFPATRVACTDADPREIERATESSARFWSWIDKLRQTAESMVVERPPFDEPKDEEEGEQEDGHLRQEWLKAYYRGKLRYELREEKYRVYDYRGNPTPPQVCIDFVFDTVERASGTWYRKRGRRPGKEAGFLDFSQMEGLLKRQTPSVLEFASLPESPLERYDIPSSERVPFRRRSEFAAALSRHAEQIREGDILVIHGLREEDLERHYHSVLVLRTDPMTGMPMVVADNSGKPRIRPLASAMRSAPRRSVKHRVRINFDWLHDRWLAFERRGEVGSVPQSAGSDAGPP